MYHSQSQTPRLNWAREEAEEAIYAGGGTLHPVCSHYAQAGGERPLNGVGNPSLSIFLWPLYDEGLQSNEALGDFVSASRPGREGEGVGGGAATRRREQRESEEEQSGGRQTMLLQDGGGLIATVSLCLLVRPLASPLPALSAVSACELQGKLFFLKTMA